MARTLDPPDFELSIELNPDAPAELQGIGTSYWELDGLDPETGDPVWTHRTRDLDFKVWSGTAHYAAAAAVTATVLEYFCTSCGGELTLTSRQALTHVRQGKNIDCRSCSAAVEDQAAKVLSPKASKERARRLSEQESVRLAEEEKRKLELGRREAIVERYPVENSSSEHLIDQASILAKVGALAVLHAVGDSGGLIYPIDFNDDSIGPDQSISSELFMAAWNANLLQIHPTSPSGAFVWEEDVKLGGGVYIHKARFFLPERALSNSASRSSPPLFVPGSTWPVCGRRNALNWPSWLGVSSRRKPAVTSFICSANTGCRI
ncbi:hypothetical protein [Parafrankia sp. FMc2]|uniref:hypothetical protein n=1 Tax=Parafrankia sp. FMc2 TaxID=3233196 RepID=UPI0034D617D5